MCLKLVGFILFFKVITFRVFLEGKNWYIIYLAKIFKHNNFKADENSNHLNKSCNRATVHSIRKPYNLRYEAQYFFNHLTTDVVL